MSSTSSHQDLSFFHEFLLTLKYEVYNKKKLFKDYYNTDHSKLTIRWSELVQVVPFVSNKPLCDSVFEMRQHGRKTLSLAGIEFFNKGKEVSFNFTTMLDYLSTRGVVRRLSSGKADLSSSYVRNEYIDLQLQQHVDAIKVVLKDVYNNNLKRELLLSFSSKLMRDCLDDDTQSQAVADDIAAKKNNFIITNIKSFLSDLQGTSKGSVPEQHSITKRAIISAALYGYDAKTVPQGISIRSISEHLGINYHLSRNTIINLSEPSTSYASDAIGGALNPEPDPPAEPDFNAPNPEIIPLILDSESESDDDSDYNFENDVDEDCDNSEDESIHSVDVEANDYSNMTIVMLYVFRVRSKRSDVCE